MKPAPRVRDCMKDCTLMLRPEMDVMHALGQMLEHNLPGAPVISGEGQLVGMLSQKDCLRPAIHAAYFREWGNPVSQHMTRAVDTMEADLELVMAARKFLSRPFQQYPVIDGNRLVGMIGRQEILSALIRQWQ